MQIYLGHPYSGALYAYFDTVIDESRPFGHRGTYHSYYSTLYGKTPQKYLEIALTLLMLYDEVWLSHADFAAPSSKVLPESSEYIHELGLHLDRQGRRAFDDLSLERERFSRYLHDPEIQKLFSRAKIPDKHVRSQILVSAMHEADISAKKRIPLACSVWRRALINRLIDIDRPSLHPILPDLRQLKFLDVFRDCTGLALAPKTIDQLMLAKPDKDVRQYSRQFLDFTMRSRDEINDGDEAAMAQLILDALNTEKISRHYAGHLKWAGVLFRLADIKTGSAISGLGSAIANHWADRSSWVQITGSIDRAISIAESERRAQMIINRAGRG